MLCKHEKKHIQRPADPLWPLQHNHPGQVLLFRTSSSQWRPPPLSLSGIMTAEGWQLQPGSAIDCSGEPVSSSSIWLWLTPSAGSRLQLRLHQAPELSFQRSAQKRLSLWTKTASLHTSKQKPDIGLSEGTVTTKAWKKVPSSNSYFPKPVDGRCSLHRAKGNRTVNGVRLILLNRRQLSVNAYVHNYAWVLSTVWLSRSDNILVNCLVISSV